ncbi:hypothetical protein ACFW1A_33500 [Kitasatospora sp. NPDC058965]|uniref:hypothetical protein n=1 Tax=Kitasatospora sp. NPDC058965 TaxID=3346682 RepID=UPI00369285D9
MDDSMLSAALGSAGLTYLGLVDPTEPLIPPDLAGFIVNCDDAYVFFADGVDLDDPRLAARLNESWRRGAEAAGLLGGAPFLLGVAQGAGAGSGHRTWARVTLTEPWDLAGAPPGPLGHGPGRPTFVMLSADGEGILRMSYGEVMGECTVVRGPARVPVLRAHAERMLGRARLDPFTRSAVERWLAAHPTP